MVRALAGDSTITRYLGIRRNIDVPPRSLVKQPARLPLRGRTASSAPEAADRAPPERRPGAPVPPPQRGHRDDPEGDQTLTRMASPWPPPPQSAAAPSPPPRRFSSSRSVRVMRL